MTKLVDIQGIALPELLSGRVCLDFTNTVEPRDGIEPNQPSRHADNIDLRDYVGSYQALVAWGTYAGTIAEDVAERLRTRARQEPKVAETTLKHALEMRETIYRIFWNIAHEQAPSSADVQALLNA
ncbi:MAG TPA: ABATE domain-containing protein, partial [Roseiflexaceae bacterium]|nr:ABATE domain-containing protein [Roseiflexaceae bacterium]